MIAALSLDQPLALLLVLLAPGALLFERRRDAVRARRRRDVFGPRFVASDRDEERRRAGRVGAALSAAAIVAAALALAGPRWGAPEFAAAPGGRDLVVCLDVSRSMRARDLPPDRLTAARAELAALLQRARGDRVGLVAFAGAARLRVPLTRDLGSLDLLLGDVDETAVAQSGTDLAAAIDTALSALVGNQGAGVVVLLTDGEDPEGRGLEAARRCRSLGVAVHCLGFGTARGGKIPIDTGAGEQFLRDAAGRDVVSVVDRDGLRALAEAAGGEFVAVEGADRGALVDLYERRVLGAGPGGTGAGGAAAPPSRFQWPLLLAAALWLLQLGLLHSRPGGPG